MANRIEVTISELQSAAKKIEECVTNYESSVKAMKSAADALAGSWEGDASKAFTEEQEKANAWYTKMIAIVREYIQQMQNAADKYVETDSEAATIIKTR